MPPVTPAGALLGRDSEMALLTTLIREVARGRGCVLIEGEPGVGKSALVRASVVGAREADCRVFWGTGDELGQALPLPATLDPALASPGISSLTPAETNIAAFVEEGLSNPQIAARLLHPGGPWRPTSPTS
jgi:DNA-binding NarL/FixJ family response regulator